MKRTVARRKTTNARRGRGARFASRELGLTLADWATHWGREDGNLRERLAAWREVVSGEVVIDDE